VNGRKKAQKAQKENPKSRRLFLAPCVPLCGYLPMSDKLTEIMAHKRVEIAPQVRPVSLEELAELNARLPRPPSFASALRRPDGRLAVIAEIKRRSPSAGAIKEGVSALEQAKRYQAAGADALSVLTDEKYFGGRLDDLREVTAYFAAHATAPSPGSGQARPCIRKDFMVHPVQVLQARAAGASAILIIVRALTDADITTLYAAAKAAGLDALFEIHTEAELTRAVGHGAGIIGVNNRDLAIFRTDLGLSEKLIPLFPKDVTAVSESGIFTAADAARARACGAHAVLVGEALMKATDPAVLLNEFRS
jgi:indole-3-glycerol phosphate synthase